MRARCGAAIRRVLVLGVAAAAACSFPLDTVEFEATEEVFANPERGFYLPRDTHSDRYAPLGVEELRRARAEGGMTLVYRGFILDDFVDSPISADYLSRMGQDFAALREAGFKAIVRFAYTTGVKTAPGTRWPPIQPYGDADLGRILGHIEQLEPVLRANADVIAAVQAGFIGIWGEWFYTDHFAGEDLDSPTPEHWESRRQVVGRLLEALPESLPLQVRTPQQKQMLTGSTVPLDPIAAFGATPRARLGHHNDCFLASDTDYGTYRDLEADYGFLEVDTRYVAVGGETCNPNPPRSTCASALVEMARLHWSYLNSGYHQVVLGSWREGGCMAEVERRLGYRLSMVSARYARQARPGVGWRLQVGLVNEGFAAPYMPRRVEVVLRHRGSGREFRADLGVDLRRLSPETPLVIDQTLGLGDRLPEGLYEVFLHLPDPDPVLARRPEYAIRLANRDVWDEATGYNRLQAEVRILDPTWLPARAEVVLKESAPARQGEL